MATDYTDEEIREAVIGLATDALRTFGPEPSSTGQRYHVKAPGQTVQIYIASEQAHARIEQNRAAREEPAKPTDDGGSRYDPSSFGRFLEVLHMDASRRHIARRALERGESATQSAPSVKRGPVVYCQGDWADEHE